MEYPVYARIRATALPIGLHSAESPPGAQPNNKGPLRGEGGCKRAYWRRRESFAGYRRQPQGPFALSLSGAWRDPAPGAVAFPSVVRYRQRANGLELVLKDYLMREEEFWKGFRTLVKPIPLRYPVRTGPGAQPNYKGATRTVRMGWRRFWRRRESNPRPTVRPEGPYMLSRCWLRSGQAQRRPTTIVPGGLYKSYSRPGPQPSPSLRWRSVPAREGKPGRASCYLLSSESKLFVCT